MAVSLKDNTEVDDILEKNKILHHPVMKQEVIEYLNPDNGDIFLDCTVGNGGHAGSIIQRIIPEGKLIGIDQDEESLLMAHKFLDKFEDNVVLIKENFQNVDKILEKVDIDKLDGVLFDLGVSSLQISTPDRGFSFKHDGPLDMRMDRNKKISAFDLVNNLSFEEISKIIRRFGEERFSKRIARAIVKSRKHEYIHTTKQLAKLIKHSVPPKYRYGRIHPATRTFQAFRIAVNRELTALENGLKNVMDFMKSGARICVISFHSLEDRIVKNIFKKYAKSGELNILTKKPLTPSKDEIKKNRRSRSAKFRVSEKT